MRLLLRHLFDSLIAGIPPFFVRGFMKTFERHPTLALRSGYRVYPQCFYSPLIDPAEIDPAALSEKRSLPGIPIDMIAAEKLTAELARYRDELDWLPRIEGTRNVIWSETYTTSDTGFLYTLLRHLKPKRYIEIGCGHSSAVSSTAICRNREEGFPCQAFFIEPFPGPRLDRAGLAGELLVKRAQEVPLSFFEELEAGDILFIDSTHVMKTQSDVEYEFLHIIPSLKKGVYIHVHDIFTPYDYPSEWIIGPRENWGAINEQYALECLLSSSSDLKILLPLYLMHRDYPHLLESIVPGATDRAQAIWLFKE